VDVIDRRQLKPVEHHGLVRLGRPGDGGYVVPDAQVTDARVLLSLGMKDDWSFDRDFVRANPGVRVICVDPSVGPRFFARRIATSLAAILGGSLTGRRTHVRRHIARLRNDFDYFVFFAGSRRHLRKRRHVQKKVSGHDTATDVTVASLLETAVVERDHSVFLKMDIEGAEYGLIPGIVDQASRFSCIVAEFHGLNRKAGLFNRSIALLRRHFQIVHIHGNNYSRYDAANHFSDAVEITFVNLALMPGEPVLSQREYPRADLDRPNHPGRPDHPLRFD
jgi:hypothetical protein